MKLSLLIHLRKDYITVALDNRIYVYHFSSGMIKFILDTCPNENGIFSVNFSPNFKLAFPSKSIGNVNIFHGENNAIQEIKCFAHFIGCIELNKMGDLLVVSPVDGKEIKIFNSIDGKLLKVFKRGSSIAKVTSLIFHPLSVFLSCCSNKESVHIFVIKNLEIAENNANNNDKSNNNNATYVQNLENQKSPLHFLGSIFSFFENEYSYSRIKLKEEYKICGFVGKQNIIIITNTHKAYLAELPDNTGYSKLIKEFEL